VSSAETLARTQTQSRSPGDKERRASTDKAGRESKLPTRAGVRSRT
jgi:hypothetical protein